MKKRQCSIMLNVQPADDYSIKEKEEERKKAIMAKQAQKMSSFFKAKPLATPPRPISRESPAGPSCEFLSAPCGRL